MFIGGSFNIFWKTVLWAKAANTATKLENTVVKVSNGFQKYFGKDEKKSILSLCKNLMISALLQTTRKISKNG